MQYCKAWLILLLLTACLFAQNNITTEGGNVTEVLLNMSQDSIHWAGIVGNLNGSAVGDLNLPVSSQNVPNSSVFYNQPNGSYASFFNTTMIVTRLPFKPDPSQIYSPSISDFNETGMFSTFATFALMGNYSRYTESPYNTFLPFLNTTCYIYETALPCYYIILKNNTRMGILKFDNGTAEEPLFVNTIESLLGYNGSYFDFEYLVPVLETYRFYIYAEKECNITVWIDDVQTATFPNTGVPYKVVAQVRNINGSVMQNARIMAVEANGRNIFYPVLDAARKFFGSGYATTNSSGMATFVLTPTRYNIPDAYGYEVYFEVDDAGFYCRRNLSIASYGALNPTYRTSLVNSNYASQVKASTQNMGALARVASRWVAAQKIREKNITVHTNGTVEHNSSLLLKAGAPNLLNITVNDSGSIVNATLDFSENEGLIIFVPLQPDKDAYTNEKTFYSNETIIIIPTKYNNNANITVSVSYGGSEVATLVLDVDPNPEEPASGEKDMGADIYAVLASSLQNINAVLANIGKSLSTV